MKKPLVIGVIAVVVGSVAIYMVYSKDKSGPAQGLKTATIAREDVARVVLATGKIEPLTRVELKSRASGVVERLLVDVADSVTVGQVVAELDKLTLEARVREARGSFEAAKAELEKAQIEAEPTEYEYSQKDLQRTKELFSKQLVSHADMDTSEKNLRMASSRYQAARSRLAVAKAQLIRAQAELDRADEELRNSRILSPITGIVLSRDVEVGNAVASVISAASGGTQIMTIADVGRMHVTGKVPESDVGKISVGMPARIGVESFRDEKFSGQVSRISPLGKEQDNVTSFEVEVVIENDTRKLKTGMTANAEIILEEHPKTIVVAEAAIIYGEAGDTSVEIPDAVSESGRKKIPIKVGISNGIKTEVLEGLKEGDRVVLR
ncbi:MAG TPA: efflux RND transporter periplasmic adaptor subunit [Patescibacteria group bacterium]|jgi:HlyD family secretion protein|nr:efflux RND transporter periplasmic adaptor subunit [Patescibacteria group bacterium]